MLWSRTRLLTTLSALIYFIKARDTQEDCWANLHKIWRSKSAVWLKPTICKYDLNMRAYRSNLQHPNWLLPDSISSLTCLIPRLRDSCTVWGSETAGSPLELSLQVKWATASWVRLFASVVILIGITGSWDYRAWCKRRYQESVG